MELLSECHRLRAVEDDTDRISVVNSDALALPRAMTEQVPVGKLLVDKASKA